MNGVESKFYYPIWVHEGSLPVREAVIKFTDKFPEKNEFLTEFISLTVSSQSGAKQGLWRNINRGKWHYALTQEVFSIAFALDKKIDFYLNQSVVPDPGVGGSLYMNGQLRMDLTPGAPALLSAIFIVLGPPGSTISAAAGAITNALNTGSGVGLFRDKVSTDLRFWTLNAGNNIALTPTGTGVRVDVVGAGLGTVTSVNGVLPAPGGNVTLMISDISGVATVAVTGDYNDLLNKPTILPDAPNNGLSYIRQSGSWVQIPNYVRTVNGNTPDSTGAVVISAAQISGFASVAYSGNYNDLANRPVLATVATTGNYNDLSNRPTILPDAPSDGTYYARRNASWQAVVNYSLPAASVGVRGGIRIGTGLAIASTDILSLSAALSDLTNVTITTPSNGQVLSYSSGTWTNASLPPIPVGIQFQNNGSNLGGAGDADTFNVTGNATLSRVGNTLTLSVSGGGGGSSTLSGLTDVTITTPSNNQFLRYDGGTSKWVNSTFTIPTPDLEDLGDVTVTTPSNGQVLTYDSGASQWVNLAIPARQMQIQFQSNGSNLGSTGTATTFNVTGNATFSRVSNAVTLNIPTVGITDLTGVTITTPSNGQFLRYDSGSSSWINSTYTPPVPSLNDLTNVTITTPSLNQVLSYNGSTWVNTTLSIPPGTLVGLTDVNITSVANGQVLTYDSGSGDWINAAIPVRQLQIQFQNNGSNLGTLGTATSFNVIGNATLSRIGDALTLNVTGGGGGGGAENLSDLEDVQLGALNNDDVLTYNSSTLKWENKPFPASSTALDDLTDVTISGVANGQVLTYNSGSSTWENLALPARQVQVQYQNAGSNLGSAGTVSTFNVTGAGTLSRVSDTVTLNIPTVTVPDELNDLNDVTLTSPTNGQFLGYNGSVWINTALPGSNAPVQFMSNGSNLGTAGTVVEFNVTGNATFSRNTNRVTLDIPVGVESLEDLDDVTITTPSNSQVLSYNSGVWVNATLPSKQDPVQYQNGGSNLGTSGTATTFNVTGGATLSRVGNVLTLAVDTWSTVASINDLNDVTVTTPSNGQVLTYNGVGQWVNTTPAVMQVPIQFQNAGSNLGASGTVTTFNATGLASLARVGNTVTLSIGSISLDALSDVTITTPSNNQILMYDNGTSQWRNQTLTIPTVPETLGDLTNVNAAVDSLNNTTDVNAGLIWTGTEWSNGAFVTKITTPGGELTPINGEVTLDLSDLNGIEEAPNDGEMYVRKNEAWELLEIDGGSY